MLKTTMAAVLAAVGGLSASMVSAAPAVKCEPPVIQVASGKEDAAQYTIQCEGNTISTLTPSLSFSGTLWVNGTPPYEVKAAYQLDVRSLAAKKLDTEPRVDQIATGTLQAATVSVAALPTQFAAHTSWDAKSSVFSIEEKPGVWRAYAVQYVDDAGATLSDAGLASAPVIDGGSFSKIVLGKTFSRFAGKGADAPVVTAKLGLRDGKFEVLMGESRAAAQKQVQDAILKLDRKPGDVTRAWALASIAQFLGLDDEVRYAEQKVAARNPQVFDEFQQNVQRIQPYEINQ